MEAELEIVRSWVLYAIREVIGLEKIRNYILEKNIDNQSIVYGPTFTLDNTYSDIYKCVNNFVENSNKQYLIFTGNNSVRENQNKRIKYSNTLESHYQTFVIDKVSKIALIIDPSRNKHKPGIYNPYIGKYLSSFFEELDLEVKWLYLSNPCQIEYHDVFCQSWTLFLTIKWFEWTGLISCIPDNQDAKYSMLLEFFKQLLSSSKFNDELLISYKESIKNHENYYNLIKYNPCKILEDMKVKDMY